MVCSSEQLTGLSLCFCIDVIVCLRIYASKIRPSPQTLLFIYDVCHFSAS